MTRKDSQMWTLFCESKTQKQPSIDLREQSIWSHYTFAFVAQQFAFLWNEWSGHALHDRLCECVCRGGFTVKELEDA